MAILKSGFLGKISGRLGDYVFRNTIHGIVVAKKPAKYKKPVDKESVKRRKKFTFLVKLASALMSLQVFKQHWSAIPPKGSSCQNKFVKKNYHSIDDLIHLSGLKLVDEYWFWVPDHAIMMNEEVIKIKLDPFPKGTFDLSLNKSICAAGILYLSNDIDGELTDYQLIPVCSKDEPLKEGKPISFTIPVALRGIHEKFKNSNLMVTLITKTVDGKPVHGSL